jgi:hypothetical protein
MNTARAQEFQRLIDLLHEADAIQQALLGDEHEAACYEFHNALNNIAEEIEDFAAEEEKTVDH